MTGAVEELQLQEGRLVPQRQASDAVLQPCVMMGWPASPAAVGGTSEEQPSDAALPDTDATAVAGVQG